MVQSVRTGSVALPHSFTAHFPSLTAPLSLQVVGRRETPAIDIYHTKKAGWAVRNPPSYYADYERGIFKRYEGKTLKEGTPLAVYAGELITREESDIRAT